MCNKKYIALVSFDRVSNIIIGRYINNKSIGGKENEDMVTLRILYGGDHHTRARVYAYYMPGVSVYMWVIICA